jgi:Ran GTPase-activating protein (RanGAP) involved in mRNA processing and transport
MLKVLNLSYNGFGTEGAIALADALKANTVLIELDITDNRILVEGVKAIAKVIASCEVLETLKIGKNPMQLMGVIALLDSLKNGTSSVKTLELDVRQCIERGCFHSISLWYNTIGNNSIN